MMRERRRTRLEERNSAFASLAAGKFLYYNPKHYVRRVFWNKDPAECIAKWGGEILRTAWIHAATDSMRGRNPTKQAQHLQAVLKSMEKFVEENRVSDDHPLSWLTA